MDSGVQCAMAPGSANRGEEKDLIFLPLPYQSFGSTIAKHQIQIHFRASAQIDSRFCL